MAIRRRHPQAPYEVMGGSRGNLDEPGLRASGWPPTDRDGETVDMEPGDSGITAGGTGMSGRSQTAAPILVRVPRAYALIFVGMLIGLVVLAYWVGSQRGAKAARKEMSRHQEQQMQLGKRVNGHKASVGTLAPAGSQAGSEAGKSVDPRTPGLNYYVVVLLPKAEALEASEFFGANGVETFVQLVENRGLYEVIALRGFEKANRSAQDFERELKRLGRLWGKGPKNFEPWLRKYDEKISPLKKAVEERTAAP